MRRRGFTTGDGSVELGDEKSSKIHVPSGNSSSKSNWVIIIGVIVLVSEYFLISSFRSFTNRIASRIFRSSNGASIRISSKQAIPPIIGTSVEMYNNNVASAPTTLLTNNQNALKVVIVPKVEVDVTGTGNVAAKYYFCKMYDAATNECTSLSHPPLQIKLFGNIDFPYTDQEDKHKDCVGSNLDIDFYAEFMGVVQFPTIGDWTLYTLAGDRSHLYVDGKSLIDGIQLEQDSGIISITEARQKKDIRIKYNQRYSGCGLTVSWSHPSKPMLLDAIPPEFWV